MRIGIFGGTFDPVHLGHLNLVKQFKKTQKLDKVIVVVANLSPFKVNRPPRLDAKVRLGLVKETFEGLDGVEVSSIEIDRGGVSYTIDTVKSLIEKYEKDELILMLTQDALQNFEKWKDAEEIRSIINIIFAVDEKKDLKGVEQNTTQIPWFNCSSTLIRDKLKKGECCKEFLSLKVLDYIAKHQLYSKAYDNE